MAVPSVVSPPAGATGFPPAATGSEVGGELRRGVMDAPPRTRVSERETAEGNERIENGQRGQRSVVGEILAVAALTHFAVSTMFACRSIGGLARSADGEFISPRAVPRSRETPGPSSARPPATPGPSKTPSGEAKQPGARTTSSPTALARTGRQVRLTRRRLLSSRSADFRSSTHMRGQLNESKRTEETTCPKRAEETRGA
jgi:hypothetical protein